MESEPGSRTVKVVIPRGFGINCEAETAFAFSSLGTEVFTPHVNDLIANPRLLSQAQILVFAGGFSFGDHLGAGRVLASRYRYGLGDTLPQFIDDGGLIMGICNGFQTMVCLGLLPHGTLGPQTVSLTENTSAAFYDGWVRLRAESTSPCLYTKGIDYIELPVRHREGRLVSTAQSGDAINDSSLVCLRYVDRVSGEPTTEFPQNPNGSDAAEAALCDPSGRIFGLMPHPEAFLFPHNHPDWRNTVSPKQADGRIFFINAVDAVRRGA